MRKWTDEEETTLREEWKNSAGRKPIAVARQIARTLGRSYNSVRCKAEQMGLLVQASVRIAVEQRRQRERSTCGNE